MDQAQRGVTLLALLAACGGEAGAPPPTQGAPLDASALPYARELVSFAPGAGAGFGQDRLPDVVLGPPRGKGTAAGSLDVLSLGVGGELVLGFGELRIVDGPGPDLVVFENAFWAAGSPESVFAELGEIAVSEDGVEWHAFPCDPTRDGRSAWPGCAGWSPTLAVDPFEAEPSEAGGDAFDLAELQLTEARYVRVRDLSMDGEGPIAGFDLDAIGLVHWR